jgi:hypothetical protein
MYNQTQNQVVNRPSAAYYLSLIGGIFGLLGSLAFITFGILVYIWVNRLIRGFDLGPTFNVFGWGWTFMLGFGVWMLITSIIIIVSARRLWANPVEHTKWGAIILVFSIIGVGGLLAFIGGILALTYRPQFIGGAPYGQPQQYYGPPPPQQAYGSQQPITRICTQCGRVVQDNVKFCPNCGKQLN